MTSRLKQILQMKKTLEQWGGYDTSIAGAIGEIYAEDILGMIKEKRGATGYDVFFDGEKVSVKTKEHDRRLASKTYVTISEKNRNKARYLLFVIIHDNGNISHFGPMPIKNLTPRGERYYLNDIEKISVRHTLNVDKNSWITAPPLNTAQSPKSA